MRVIAMLVCLLALPGQGAAAQRLAPDPFPSLDAPGAPTPALRHRADTLVPDRRPTDAELILPSLLGGIGTFWLTAYLGAQFEDSPCDSCGLTGGLFGAAMGFGLGSAAGAHLANGRRGSLGTSALVGVAIGAAGTLAAIETDRWEILLAIPIAQIASAITIERRHRTE